MHDRIVDCGCVRKCDDEHGIAKLVTVSADYTPRSRREVFLLYGGGVTLFPQSHCISSWQKLTRHTKQVAKAASVALIFQHIVFQA